MAVTGNRRKFRRKGGTARREAPMDAALQGMAEGGAQAATLQAIADRAGMAPGLILQCFQSGQDRTRAACGRLMDKMMAALPCPADAATLRARAIACNAVIDDTRRKALPCPRPALTVKLPASA
jgi:AcrR family transcriptional regulator